MNTPLITALATYVPRTIALNRGQTTEKMPAAPTPSGWDRWIASWHTDYASYASQAATLRTNDAADGATQEYYRVPVEHDTDLSGLAAKVAHTLCHARPPEAAPIDIVMFCHSSFNEHVSTTVAGRLRAVVGTSCFPFSVAQQQGASAFTALQLAGDLLIAESDIHTILIVAAEKWCSPFPRWTDQGLVQGDAAAALLVERATCTSCGLAVIDARTSRLHRMASPPRLARPDIGTDLAPLLLSTIDAIRSRHKLRVDDLGTVVGPTIDPHLDECIAGHLNRRVTGLAHGSRAHLGAPEWIVRLADSLESHNLPLPDPILIWGIGLGGYVGCALLESHGRPRLYHPIEHRNPS